MNRDGPLRLAVVGCGAVVERFHLPAVRQVPGVKLSALVEKDSTRLRQLGLRYPGARLCRDLDELPAETDAALVAVPNALHAPIATNLLRRGIHVLCEKPMAITLEACDAMVQASRETGSVLVVGHHKRFVPSVRQAKKLLDEGRLGAIRSITGSMGMPRTWRSRTAFHLDHSLAGGGVLIENGVHLVDLVLWIVGDVEVLRCHLIPEGAVLEEEAKLEFRAGPDACGVLRLSDRRVLPNMLRVEGEEGFLEFDTFDSPSLKVFLRTAPLCRSCGTVFFRWPKRSPYESQMEHFVGFVSGKEPALLNGGEEAMQSIRVVAEAYREAGRSQA